LTVKSIRNLCGLLLVLLSFSAARAEFRPDLAGIELDRVTLTVDRKILNPVHEKEAKGKLTLTVLVNQNSVRHSLGRVEGQDAGFPETAAGLPGWEPTRVVPTVVLGQISLRKKL
jgi:hypothetical protein